MAEIIKEELNIEEFEIKEEFLPSFTVEDTSTFILHKDDIKMEDTEIQGKPNYFTFSYKKLRCFIINRIV